MVWILDDVDAVRALYSHAPQASASQAPGATNTYPSSASGFSPTSAGSTNSRPFRTNSPSK